MKNYLNILKSAVDLGADMLVLKSVNSEIHLFKNESDKPPHRITHDLTISNSERLTLEEDIQKISFSCNDLKSALPKIHLGESNLIFKNDSGHLVFCKIKTSHASDKTETLQIDFIKSSHNDITEFITVSTDLEKLAEEVNRSKDNIIVFNSNDKIAEVVLTNLMDNCTYYHLNELQENLLLLNNFGEGPIMIGHTNDDPVDGLLSVVEWAKKSNHLPEVIQKITASVILKSLKKQCGICSKPTAITDEARNRFPDHYKEAVPSSYQFSRGCSSCNFTSYRGVAFIECILPVKDNLKKQLMVSSDHNIVYEEMVNQKGSTLYENSITQMRNGILSVEEVLKVLPPISNSFDKFLSKNKGPNRSMQRMVTKDVPTILIIEDDINQREILQMVFKKEGYNVCTAENGQEALEIAAIQDIQVILSDLMMPVMNGLDFLKCCKKDLKLSNIPILMLTATANPDHELTLLDQGADDYCPKNVKKKILLKRVERLLQKHTNSGAVDHLLD